MSTESKGQVGIPVSDQQPIIVAVDYLSLQPEHFANESTDSDSQDIDPLASFDPASDIGLFSVSISQLSFNDIDYGAWQFSTQPQAKGLNVRDIRGSVKGLEVTGALNWYYEQDRHVSSIKFNLISPNTKATLEAFKADEVISARNSQFELALNWPGTPLAFDPLSINGTMWMNLQQGVIKAVPDSYEQVSILVKLIGLVNVSKVFSRFAFNFEDLTADGLSFDVLDAEFIFNDGKVNIDQQQPFVIEGGSIKMQVFGHYDIASEMAALQGKMVIPLSSSGRLLGYYRALLPHLLLQLCLLVKRLLIEN